MLELPEIRTVSRQANEALRGKTVAQVFPPTKRHRFAFYNETPEHFGDLLVGRTLLACEGHGMFVDFNFSGGITMGTSDGVSLRYAEAGAPIPEDYQLLVAFDDDSFLVLTVRMYGFILISADGRIAHEYYRKSHESLSPLSDAYTEAAFDRLFAEAPPSLTAKGLLATEQRIPGIGNGVTQDILFNAGIHPKQRIRLLDAPARERLFRSVKETLAAMVRGGGRDTEKDLFGRKGGYATRLCARTWGNPCPRCGGRIVKEAYMGGSVYYCPHCQPIVGAPEK